jgi:tetratricopeptide (TPR) repeat protein
MTLGRRILLLFTTALALGVAQTSAAQTIYELKGKVYGPDGKPLANVLVALENNARAMIAEDITNSDGRYQFNGIIAGTYYISVKPDEKLFRPVFQMVDLINTTIGGRGTSVETVDFSLRPAAVQVSHTSGVAFAQTIPAGAEKEYEDGMKSLMKGDKEQATNQLHKAIDLFPNYFLALQQLGLLQLEQGKYEEAIKSLSKAVAINSKAARAYLGLGIAYVNLDRSKEAVSALTIARQLDSRGFTVHLYLGMALISTGELDQAETSLKQALIIGGSAQARAAHLYLASIYDNRKQYKMAIDQLEIYLRENPKAANAANIKQAIAKLRARL